MSSIATKQIYGDVTVGRNVRTGGGAEIKGSVRIGHNLKVEGWLEAPNIKGVIKGIYASREELERAYPRPGGGWIAGVGTSLPCDAYMSEGGQWSEEPRGTITVNVNIEALEESIAEATAEISDLQERIAVHIQESEDRDATLDATKLDKAAIEVMTESAYESLRNKDEDKYYLTYED